MKYVPTLCTCGHHQGQHLMRAHQSVGRCSAGAYGNRGQFIGWACDCERFRKVA